MSLHAGSRDHVRILVVDDHAGFRRRARAILEDGGLDVVGEAADGPECLAAVAALRPDAVVLDVRLPGEDGFRVAERLAATGNPPPVVLVSSRSLVEFGPRPVASCVRGFITKADLSAPAVLALLAG
ncbi:MAG TPA: response regulator transcription factor [Candidatus Limnocylindrales bacterium]|nr:response regulator transcription factor [Candidatus Limnocylindrales bacterium]